MKGIIKLYPTNGKIKVGLRVLYNNNTIKVTDVNELFINKIIPITHVKLLKYYLTNKTNIIGQLAYEDYDKVKENMVITEYTSERILNKMEVGDNVTIHKLTGDLYAAFKKLDGIIVDINGRRAKVAIHGFEKPVELKRHMFMLKKGNFRNIIRLCSKES